MFKTKCALLSLSILILSVASVFDAKSLNATVSVQTPPHKAGTTLINGPMAFPAGFMPSIKSYGAVGDGKTDDTAAIQRALADGRSSASADYFGHPKALYFPPGTYLVHDTLTWVGCSVTFQGAGTASTVIRLAPSSPGFGNVAVPKPLILTPKGNTSFHQQIWDLRISIGSGNPGATALNYVSNNMGSVHNVLIKSEDGKGHAGIDLTRQWAGPMLIRNTQVEGFDTGIDLGNSEYSVTFESIALKTQNVVGIHNLNQPIEIRALSSTNSVPALVNVGGFVVLMDSQLKGGVGTQYGLQNNKMMYLRNITSSGYLATLQDTSTKTPTIVKGTIAEYLVGTPQTLSGKLSMASLNLPVQETPIYTGSTTTGAAPFVPKWYGDASGLQAVLNSGKEMVYFPFTTYFAKNEVTVVVPDTVNRITGYSSVFFGDTSGFNGGSIKIVVSSNSTIPLIIDQISGVKIYHTGARPVVIKDAELDYTNAPGAGSLFLEDVQVKVPLTVQVNQQVWARQLNDEVATTKITNQGGKLWIFGLKTENTGDVIDTSAGGETELLGALIYPADPVASSVTAFHSEDSNVSYIYAESAYSAGKGYAIQVNEIRSGTSKAINSSPDTKYFMPLFIGYQ